MRKIKAVNRNDNDRIICVTADGRHDFYYQPVGSKRRHWLVSCSFAEASLHTSVTRAEIWMAWASA